MSAMRYAAMLVILAACSRQPPKPEPAEAGAAAPSVHVDPSLFGDGGVTLARVERRALRGDLRLPGTVVPSESGAAEVGVLVAGRVAAIDVKEGDAVKAGQRLALIDSPDAARIAADAIRARARVVAAERKVARQEALESDRATSATAVDEARTELAGARADLAAARTLLASLGVPEPTSDVTVAARVPIKSPIAGVIVERMTTLGAPVAPDKTLFRIVARDRVFVDVRSPDTGVAAPEPGAPVKLFARGQGDSAACSAHVAAVLGVVDDRTRARRIRVEPDAPCATLVPGAFVDAAFTSPSSAVVLAVPREAIVDVGGARTVFVATPRDGVLVPRVVRVGATTSLDAAIDDGLREGERIAVTGAVLLKGELQKSELESP